MITVFNDNIIKYKYILTCACMTSYSTTVRSVEHVSTLVVVRESSKKLSLIGSVCALHVLYEW